MAKEYKILTEEVADLGADFFERDVPDVLVDLQSIVKKNSKYNTLFIESNYEDDVYECDDGEYVEKVIVYKIFGYRTETEAERIKRVEKTSKTKANIKARREKKAKEKEAAERKEYERLKAKFGGEE
jgi:hypothetical protein